VENVPSNAIHAEILLISQDLYAQNSFQDHVVGVPELSVQFDERSWQQRPGTQSSARDCQGLCKRGLWGRGKRASRKGD